MKDLELHYQNVLFIVFKLVGFYTQAEYHTSEGRVDLVVKTADYIYVMEFKLEGTAEEALQQIEEKQYALPFEADPRKLFKIGVNFSNKTRNIEKLIIEWQICVIRVLLFRFDTILVWIGVESPFEFHLCCVLS